MDAEAQQLQARIAEVTKALRAERNRLTTLERFEATTALQPVVSATPTPRMSTSTNGGGRRSTNGVSAARKLPIEVTAPMTTARDELKTARDTTATLERSKERAAAQLQAAQEDAARAEEQCEAAAAATGWNTEGARHYRSPLQRKSAVTALQREVGELHAAEHALHAEGQRLGHAISAASLQLLDYDELDWELYKTRADVKIHEDLRASVDDEIRSIERIFAKKEQLLAKTLATTNKDIVLALEADKQVQQARLTRHQAASRDTAASTRHRALAIMQREEKLRFYGDAIKTVLNVDADAENDGDDTAEAAEPEMVAAEEIDAVRAQIADARRHDEQLQGQLEFLDAQVGNLEARVDILVRATMSLEADEQREADGHQRRLGDIERSYKRQLQTAESMIATQRESVEAKSVRVKKLRAKSEEQPPVEESGAATDAGTTSAA